MVRVLEKYKLTPQEQRVVLLAMSGGDDTSIAGELGISRETVRVYWRRIRERVGHTKRGAIISQLMRETSELLKQDQADAHEQLLAEITRRTKAEEQLRAILDGARDFAIILMGPDRMITEYNKGAENILGWSKDEAIGQSCDMIFCEEDRRRGVPEAESKGAIEKGHVSDVRWHCKKDGSRFWAVGSMNAIYYQDGTHRGFVKVFADETRLRELEENRSGPRL
jgi:PAS domain S-box-containing protein